MFHRTIRRFQAETEIELRGTICELHGTDSLRFRHSHFAFGRRPRRHAYERAVLAGFEMLHVLALHVFGVREIERHPVKRRLAPPDGGTAMMCKLTTRTFRDRLLAREIEHMQKGFIRFIPPRRVPGVKTPLTPRCRSPV